MNILQSEFCQTEAGKDVSARSGVYNCLIGYAVWEGESCREIVVFDLFFRAGQDMTVRSEVLGDNKEVLGESIPPNTISCA